MGESFEFDPRTGEREDRRKSFQQEIIKIGKDNFNSSIRRKL